VRKLRQIALVSIAAPIAALAAPISISASPSGPTERVLLVLTPHDRGALRALAAGHAPMSSGRTAALAQALPSLAQRQSVVADARALGLHVDHQNPVSVQVSGPASLVKSLFGSARAVAATSRVQHPLPSLPSSMRGAVTIAFGGDDTRAAFRHLTATGTDFRTAYGDTGTNPTTAPPVTDTIATVQLSAWHPSDLTQFATDLHANDATWPAPQYTGIDDPSDPACFETDPAGSVCGDPGGTQYGADVEVSLDQEAIYSVAPYAKQRAYLSGNDLLGMYDSLAAIGDDASNPTIDQHIVAASISWGVCETDFASDPQAGSLFSAFEDVMSYDLASGVTLFSSTGDNGAKCDGTNIGLSYPASSPQVIAVGGTMTTGAVSDPTTAKGWAGDLGFPGASSGGGTSIVFPRPSYQSGLSVSGSTRVVPDISALAGSPGFSVFNSGPSNPAYPAGSYGTIGGTSLASPVSAATYTAELSQLNTQGYNWGVGDIHAGLYGLAGTSGTFTDVNDNCVANNNTCSGWNGVDVAHAGYDMVTGIGTPMWKNLLVTGLGGDPHLSAAHFYNNSTTIAVSPHVPAWQTYSKGYRIDVDSNASCTLVGLGALPTSVVIPNDPSVPHSADGMHNLTLVAVDSNNQCHFSSTQVFVDTTRPTATAKLIIRGGSTSNVVASWSGADPYGSGVASFAVTITGGSSTLHPTKSPYAFTGLAGHVYTLTVTATDRAGNVSPVATAMLKDDSNFSFSSGWHRAYTSAAYGGSEAWTGTAGRTASATTTGKAYTVYLTTCAACGKIGVYTTAGKLLRTIDTYSSTTRYRIPVLFASNTTGASRTYVFKALGTKNAASKGIGIIVDGLTTSG
jgi:hypothetical protein